VLLLDCGSMPWLQMCSQIFTGKLQAESTRPARAFEGASLEFWRVNQQTSCRVDYWGIGAMPAWGATSGATFCTSALKGSVRPIAPLMALSASMISCRAHEGHQYPKPCEHWDSAASELYGSVFRRHSEGAPSMIYAIE